ncbi:MAG TPA: SdrD B-like domain-containing protein, partial [bacterium]|nr:SdrD B-like domain-containing protein [bacterium]
MTGVKKILSRYKIPAAATAFCIFFFAGTSALWALTPPPGTPIVNKASARYADTNGNSLPQVEATVQTPVAGAPVLAVSKTASSDPVAMGSIITYSVNVENTGNISSENIAVTDTLSKYLEFQSASSGGIHIPGPPGGGTVSWNIPNLDSGQVLTLTVTARVKTPADFAQGDTDTIGNGTVIPNTISAVSSSASDETTMQVTVGEFPNTVISQSVSSTASLPGGTLVYTIQYGNMGNRTATGVFITNMLPDGTALVDGSITGGGLENNRLITWYVGDMAPGSQGTVSFSVTISNLAQAGDIIVNTPAINSTGQGSVAAEPVYTEITESLASFEIKKTGTPETVLAGSEITYTIEIVNTGNLPITALAIRDAVPEGTDYVSADSGGIFASGEVLWNMGNLGTGETKTVTLILKTHSALQNGALIENKARASAYQAGEQESTAQTSVSARTPGTIEFFDSSWNPESVYKVGDTIYLQVTDPDQDGDSALIETVSVVLTNETTGDRETIILTETGPATGVFRGSIPSSSAPAVEENGVISVSADTAVKASYTDPLDILPVVQDVAYIDPYGIVFDSVSGAAIAGAVVTIIDTYTGLPAVLPFDPNPAPPAGTDGKYAFPNVPPGTYYLTVSNLPAGYTFPSAVPDSEIPAGYIVANGSRGEPFTLTLSTPPLNIDIPVDPALPGLAVTKTASRNIASTGDILRYSVTIANTGSFAVKDIGVTDLMPHGIVYVKGSSRLNDIPAADPSTPASRTLVWNIPEIGAGDSVELTYNAIVGVDSRRGSGKNTVTALGTGAGQTIKSPAASFTVKINEGIFTSKGTVIGKVFIDANRNSIHDEKEPGIGNVSVYMQDGTRAVTDPEGKYSIPGVRQGTHVVRLDETTLPAELKTAPVSNRFMGSDSSQFVDMPPGGLVKANFALHETAHKGSKEVQSINTIQVASFSSGNSQKAIQTAASLEKKGFEDVRVELIDGMYAVRTGKYNAREDAEEDLKKIKKEYPGTYARKAWIVPERIVYPAPVTEEKEKNGTPAETVRTAQTPGEKQALIENEILSMTPGLAFLYPKDGSLTQKRSVNVLLKAPLDTEVALYVNGTKTGSDKLGLKVENKERKVAVYEFMAISLNPGEKNILKAEIKDAFGNIRGTMDISITTAGSPHEITVSAKENRVTADGSSSAAMEAYVTDKNGNILEYPAYMTVETSAGEILEK